MNQAGPPTTHKLQVYHKHDLLDRFVKHVSGFSGFVAVPLRKLLGVAVLLKGSDCDYVAVQPNALEFH